MQTIVWEDSGMLTYCVQQARSEVGVQIYIKNVDNNSSLLDMIFA